MDIPSLHAIFTSSSGITTDTRNIRKGALFFALKGDRFNGNTFTHQALAAGAAFAVIDEQQPDMDERMILVEDVLETLQQLASFHRQTFDIPVIGITGSNGKTTTKELMRDVLAKKYKVLATLGNLNNHIGVPLTLLQLTSEHQLAIIEMGANHLGEIALLSALSCPDYGLITNIGEAHIGEFGGKENIITAKSELYEHLRMIEGIAFVDGGSNLMMAKSEGLERVIYGHHEDSIAECVYSSSDPFLSFDWNGHQIASQLIGDYNLINMSAAIAVGTYFEVSPEDIGNAIASYVPDNNRSQLIQKGEARIIMDAYNANLDSMRAAIENLGRMTSERKLAILGDMRELGSESFRSHKEIIELVERKGINAIFVGPEFLNAAKGHAVTAVADTEAASLLMKKMDLSRDLILIKGSRGIKLEVLQEFL